MSTKINFPGGATGTYAANFSTTGYFAQQTNTTFPRASDGVNRNLDGDYTVRVASIKPHGVSGSYYTRIRYTEPSYSTTTTTGGSNYAAGAILTSSSDFQADCGVRIYKNGSSTVYFNRLSSSNGNHTARLYESDGTWNYSWSTQMCGYWEWDTVPVAPTNVQAVVSGLNVTVSYTNSASTGGTSISGYTIQKASSTDGGSSWGSWTSFTNGSQLSPGLYKFRVYATNTAGNSQAAESSSVQVGQIVRFDASTQPVGISTLKRYDGASWTNVTTVKRFDGTSWQTLEF